VSIPIIYVILFIHTFFNLHNEFQENFKSLENLNFHEKYSKKVHHIRQEKVLDWLWKKPKVEDMMFTTINKLEDKELIVLIQGDSFMEQLTNSSYYMHNPNMELLTNGEKPKNISVELVQKFKSKKKVGFVSGGTGSYSPSVMNLQLDVLEQDFKILPNVVIAYVDQSDIGDENCRYKNHRFFENGVLKSIQPESHLMWRETFNYSEIYEKSKIRLKNKSKILQTFFLTNFNFKYGFVKSSIRFYRKYISTNKVDKEKLTKCYWGTIEKYLIKHHDTETEYFKDQVKKYLENMKKKEHIEKIFFVTFPHKKNFNKTYKLNVSDVIESVVKDEKIVTHINFSKILLNDNNFNYENIYLNDGIHLNRDNHANLFMKKILDELSKYLL
tara:strand:- start:44 stop:1198 length:1155 start_codon:yes stop_codon:yes gene_type:complete